uniref:EF-hand domain-containing protein n=1 Tax=viral metagenome TaxID=1070528 RepID=A0A6C0LX04_9ZZZZ
MTSSFGIEWDTRALICNKPVGGGKNVSFREKEVIIKQGTFSISAEGWFHKIGKDECIDSLEVNIGPIFFNSQDFTDIRKKWGVEFFKFKKYWDGIINKKSITTQKGTFNVLTYGTPKNINISCLFDDGCKLCRSSGDPVTDIELKQIQRTEGNNWKRKGIGRDFFPCVKNQIFSDCCGNLEGEKKWKWSYHRFLQDIKGVPQITVGMSNERTIRMMRIISNSYTIYESKNQELAEFYEVFKSFKSDIDLVSFTEMLNSYISEDTSMILKAMDTDHKGNLSFDETLAILSGLKLGLKFSTHVGIIKTVLSIADSFYIQDTNSQLVLIMLLYDLFTVNLYDEKKEDSDEGSPIYLKSLFFIKFRTNARSLFEMLDKTQKDMIIMIVNSVIETENFLSKDHMKELVESFITGKVGYAITIVPEDITNNIPLNLIYSISDEDLELMKDIGIVVEKIIYSFLNGAVATLVGLDENLEGVIYKEKPSDLGQSILNVDIGEWHPYVEMGNSHFECRGVFTLYQLSTLRNNGNIEQWNNNGWLGNPNLIQSRIRLDNLSPLIPKVLSYINPDAGKKKNGGGGGKAKSSGRKKRKEERRRKEEAPY